MKHQNKATHCMKKNHPSALCFGVYVVLLGIQMKSFIRNSRRGKKILLVQEKNPPISQLTKPLCDEFLCSVKTLRW